MAGGEEDGGEGRGEFAALLDEWRHKIIKLIDNFLTFFDLSHFYNLSTHEDILLEKSVQKSNLQFE